MYALERITDDSPRDQPTIINLRATFVRTHAAESPEPGTDTDETFTEVPADVVAAVKITAFVDPESDDTTRVLDLSRAHQSHRH
jgi:hypothetical protein